MAKVGTPHRTSGDDDLRFIHERDWLVFAIVGSQAGADRLGHIVRSGIMPNGKRIDRCERDNLSSQNEWKIYLKEN